MTGLLIPDLSEWNSVTDWSQLPAAIVRATYGTRHRDTKWDANAAAADAHCAWWAAYAYLDKGSDPVTAARFFLSVLGAHRPHAVILDLEEGDGDQRRRRQAWLDEVHAGLPAEPEWTYSGLAFARAHLPGVRIDWIAAYQATEPTDAHTLWQYTDRHTFPGIAGAVDASLFHGTVDQLLALTDPTHPQATEDDMPTAQEIADAIVNAPVGGNAPDSPGTFGNAEYRQQSELMRVADQLANLAELFYCALVAEDRAGADKAIAAIRARDIKHPGE